MILSHKHRFIFIKGVKVAGTSAEIALSQMCGPDDVITPITPADEKYRLGTRGEPRNYASDRQVERDYLHAVRSNPPQELGDLRHPKTPFTNHMALKDVLALVPEAMGYRLIFVERSPYAKVLSFANWEKNHSSYNRGNSLGHSTEAIAMHVDEIIGNGRISVLRNIDRYEDADGVVSARPWLIADLDRQVRTFFEECGESPVELVHAKRGFGSDRVDVASVLRADQIALINELFADEFDTFGFPMVTPAANAASF